MNVATDPKTAENRPNTPRRCINEAEASRISGLSRSWLQKKRLSGDGPPYLKIGRNVRYDLESFLRWIDSHACRSTSEVTAG